MNDTNNNKQVLKSLQKNKKKNSNRPKIRAPSQEGTITVVTRKKRRKIGYSPPVDSEGTTTSEFQWLQLGLRVEWGGETYIGVSEI